ncbi:Mce associated membrane protein [Mycobacterium lentiflavum]|uniref:Mce associated membrane protein n=1 Tax=Mycobacterium lentiflavum TaxID=141349 RepID=A0A0E4CP69_MYCLN|nr:Mce protein [Mycobacterium lentiflavum]CQD17086.1 Mce associated membrane protein [Mycobacterium lentiflavum]
MADEPDTPETEEKVTEPTDADDYDAAEEAAADGATDDAAEEADEIEGRLTRWRRRATSRRLSRTAAALVASAAIVTAVTGLAGWLGFRAYENQHAQAQREQFVQVARQGAVNLTTINYTEVDADVQRILDQATGAFREDFEQRAKPFIEVVKAAQSKSEGTVTDAGLESQRGDSAQVLVAVAVKSRTAGGEEAPREWRMRIEVRSVGNDTKVSNVVFVP